MAAEQAFKVADKDNDGELDPEEAFQYVKKVHRFTGRRVTRAGFESFFDKLDHDGDGNVDFGEIKR